MSSALAIASVTYVLKDLLNDGLINNNVSASTGGLVKVTALCPDVVPDPEVDKCTKLNLFMYQATPNQGWRNASLPSRDSRGGRTGNPPLALDLHYLLTAHAREEFHSEILLGHGMLLLHENPVLARNAIGNSLRNASASGSGLPAHLSSLGNSDLAEQLEQIKITMQPMSIDEMSKLWSAFQTKYRSSAAYQISVVLLESNMTARSPLPVLRRGRPENFAGGEDGITVTTDLSLPSNSSPTIDHIGYPLQQQSACLGDSITINGCNLSGGNALVRFEGRWHKNEVAIGTVSSDQLTFLLPSANIDEWAPGPYTVSVQVQRPERPFSEATNQLPFALAPAIILPPCAKKCVPNQKAELFDVTTTIQSVPPPRQEQKISLLLNDHEALAENCDSATGRVDFSFKALPPGEYLVRLRVDGIDSRFIDYAKKPPEFIAGTVVTIP